MSFDTLVHKIRRHSREEYRQLMVDGVTDLRIWIQEHGEQAAVLGVVLGCLVVLAFKLMVWILFLALAFGITIFVVAQPAMDSASEDPLNPEPPGVREEPFVSRTAANEEGGADAFEPPEGATDEDTPDSPHHH